MYQRFLATLARLSTHHPGKILLGSILLSLVAGLIASTLTINLSFLAVMPENDPDVDLFAEVTDKFGGSTDLMLVIRSRDEAEPLDKEEAIRFAEALVARIDLLREEIAGRGEDRRYGGNVGTVSYKIDMDFVDEYGLLFVDEARLNEVAEILEPNRNALTDLYSDLHLVPYSRKLHGLLRRSVSTLGGPMPEEAQTLSLLTALDGMLDVMDEFARKGERADEDKIREKAVEQMGSDFSGMIRTYVRGGYAFSPDESILVVSVRLDVDPLSVPLGVSIYKEINRATQEVLEGYPGLRGNYAGVAAMSHEDQSQTLRRFQWLSTISLILVVALFVYISRLRSGPILVGIPLVMAVIWTFAIVRIGLGFVSMTSLVFAVLLFGLGIDFAIHIMVRFHDEVRDDPDPRRGIERAVQGSGRGVITGGLTTALAFLAMCVSDFKAATHLGFTTGWGLICCLIAMTLTFPTLLYLMLSRRHARGASPRPPGESRALTWWVRTVTRRPLAFLSGCAVLLLLFAWPLRNFRVEYDLEKIVTRNMPSIEAKRLIQEKFGRTNEFVIVISDDAEQDRELTRRIAESEADGRRIFSEVLSVSRFVPPREDQDRRRAAMRRIHDLIGGIEVETRAADGSPLEAGEVGEIADVVDRFREDLRRIRPFFPKREAILGRLDALEGKCGGMVEFLRDEGNLEELRRNLGHYQFVVGERTAEFLDKLARMSDPTTRDGKEKGLTVDSLPPGVRDRFVSRKDDSLLIMAYPKNASFDVANVREIKRALAEAAPGRATGMMMIAEKIVAGGVREFPLILGAVLAVLLVVLTADFRHPKYLLFTTLPLLFSGVISMGIICLSGATVSVLMLSAFPLVFGIGIDDGVHILHRYRQTGDVVSAVGLTGRAIFMTTVTTLFSFGILLFTNHNGLIGMSLLIGVGVALCFVFSVTLLPAVLVLTEGRKKGSDERV